MRKDRVCLLLLLFLAVALPCFAQNSNSSTTVTETATEIKPPQSRSNRRYVKNRRGRSIEDIWETRERQIWDALQRKDMKSFASLLAEDQLFVSNDGVHSKAETVEIVSGMTLADLSLGEFRVSMLDQNTAIITYRASGKFSFKGSEMRPFDDRHTTVWVKRGQSWLAVFHQETPAGSQPGQ